MTKRIFPKIASEALGMKTGMGYVYRLDGHVMSGCLFDSVPNVKGKFFSKLFVCLLTGPADGVTLGLSENIKIPKVFGKRTDVWGAEGPAQHSTNETCGDFSPGMLRCRALSIIRSECLFPDMAIT